MSLCCVTGLGHHGLHKGGSVSGASVWLRSFWLGVNSSLHIGESVMHCTVGEELSFWNLPFVSCFEIFNVLAFLKNPQMPLFPSSKSFSLMVASSANLSCSSFSNSSVY